MSKTLNHVPVGSKVVDCSSMDYLVDLPPGALVGYRATHEGYRDAVIEILSNQPSLGATVGITAEDIAAMERDDARIAEIDVVLPAAEKLIEMLRETRALLDDQRHRRISEIAALVDARSQARRDTELHAHYEKTRAYRSAIAMKSVATRRRNQAQDEAVTGPEAGIENRPEVDGQTTGTEG